MIRTIQEADIPAISDIYKYHVLNGTGTFEIVPPTDFEMLSRYLDVKSKGLPFLVLEEQGSVKGFAYCNWFKPRPAYRFSAETSIYIAPDQIRKGYGHALLDELCQSAEQAGIRKLIAVIGDSANIGSIKLHQACNFSQTGIVKGCGWKFNTWLDIVIMEKTLGFGQTTSPE